MKVSLDEQSSLLKLAAIDASRTRINQQLAARQNSEVAENLMRQLTEVNEAIVECRANLDRGRDSLRKIQIDVELVEKRLALDESRVNTLTNSKDVTGVQHEIQSLRNRVSVLEDQELEIMEEIETSEKTLSQLTGSQTVLGSEIAVAEKSQQEDLLRFSTDLKSLDLDRESALSDLSEILRTAYLRKADRGIAVAKLDGRDCGACRLALTAAAYDDLMSTPADEIPSCPNCQAMIIR